MMGVGITGQWRAIGKPNPIPQLYGPCPEIVRGRSLNCQGRNVFPIFIFVEKLFMHGPKHLEAPHAALWYLDMIKAADIAINMDSKAPTITRVVLRRCRACDHQSR